MTSVMHSYSSMVWSGVFLIEQQDLSPIVKEVVRLLETYTFFPGHLRVSQPVLGLRVGSRRDRRTFSSRISGSSLSSTSATSAGMEDFLASPGLVFQEECTITDFPGHAESLAKIPDVPGASYLDSSSHEQFSRCSRSGITRSSARDDPQDFQARPAP